MLFNKSSKFFLNLIINMKTKKKISNNMSYLYLDIAYRIIILYFKIKLIKKLLKIQYILINICISIHELDY